MTDSQRLDHAIRSGLDLPQSVELVGIAYGETEEWDSIAHMQLVASVEREFGIMIDTDHVIAMSDYHVVCSILQEHYGLDVGS